MFTDLVSTLARRLVTIGPAFTIAITIVLAPLSTLAQNPNPGISEYGYTMLAPGKKEVAIYGRLVIETVNANCPDFDGDDGSSLASQPRKLNPAYASSFPVTVCEAVLKENVSYTAGRVSLNAATLDPSAIQIYGDSGCNNKTDCIGTTNPSPDFQLIAIEGAKRNPDLILHMGDFNYRGTSGHLGEVMKNGQPEKVWAYDAGDGVPGDPQCEFDSTYYSQNQANSPRPDAWSYWKYDFFEPAAGLLPKAPWVAARGNHELCSRAGIGWFYFFGPGSDMAGGGFPQLQCPAQGDFQSPPATAQGHIAMIPPYRLPLKQLDLWVLDTANACDGFAQNPLTAQYQQQLDMMNSLTARNPAWMMTHRPIWGYQSPGEPTLNQMLQIALSKTRSGELADSIQLSLAGHMHVYESLTFGPTSPRPPQIVVGNSGVSLSSEPSKSAFTVTVDGESATGNSVQQHGFIASEINAGDWSGTMYDKHGNVLANCDSGNPASGETICVLAAEGTD